MSLSKPTNLNSNPSLKYFTWGGDEGRIKYYDKKTSKNVFIDLPFKFIKLDSLSTVTGYSDSDDSGYWSNEVRSIKNEPFVVRTNKGIKKEGLWSDVGEALKAQGAKFANSVYIAYLNEKNELELCNIKFYGSSISQWIEFLKVDKSHSISIVGANEAKKGKTVYHTPIFQSFEITDKQLNEAEKLDEKLQEYLDKYFSYGKNNDKTLSASASTSFSNTETKDAVTEDNSDDIPF